MSDDQRPGPAAPGLAPAPIAEPPATDPVGTATEPATAPAQRTIDELAAFIVGQAGEPIDVWAVAALLESAGIRDRDAAERYGRADVFALATAVQLRLPEAQRGGWTPPPEPPRRERLRRDLRSFGRGTFFFVPLTLQLVALLAVGVSQFASVEFTRYEASRVAVAAALAFIVTAGFSQALGYLTPVYVDSGKHLLAEKVSLRVLGLGALAAVLVGALAYVVARASGGYSHEDLRIMGVYYLLLAAQGLAGALLYMLRRYVAMVVATAISLVVAAVLYRHSSLPLEQVHWWALGVAVVLELAVGLTVLRRRARATEGDLREARLPRGRLLLRRALPFGVYGFVYFAFLSADRAVSWADGTNPLPLWFHTDYELGLDWALGAIIVSLAFLEVTVETFSHMLGPIGRRYRVDAVREHNRALLQFWARQLAYLGALMAVGAWVAVVGAVVLHHLGALGRADAIYKDPITRYVFGIGLLGYAMLTLGIANSVFVMTLGRPWRIVLSIGAGLAVSVLVAVAATARWSYWTAVFGMAFGAGTFAVLSGWQAWRTLRHADYHSYAAY